MSINMNMSPPAHAAKPMGNGMPAAQALSGADRRRLNSEELLGRSQEIEIAHGSEVYRLRRTSLGKLILTK